MPDLAPLRAGYSSILVTYGDVSAGGEITYRTTDATLVQALHDWGIARTTDHGDHAEHD